MLNIFKKMFALAGAHQTPADNSSLPNSRIQQSILHDGSETATRGQLVQIMMRDLVRKSGIPPGWIQCQIQVVSSRSKGQGIHVRLVVKQWDERLMTYAFAFQKALLTEIVQFEPKAVSWLHGIAWQLEVAGSCPVTDLPASQFWQTPEVVDPFEIIPMPANATPASAMPAPKPFLPPSAPVLPVAATAPAFIPLLDPLEPLPLLADEPASPENDTAQDLERLFAIRDKELEHKAIQGLLPVGYEKTEPSPL